MPTYAYACTSCGHSFDAVQSFSDSALTNCPECDGTLRKQYGSIGVTFNGGGFYRTDSRSADKSSASSTTNAGSASKSNTGASASTASTSS